MEERKMKKKLSICLAVILVLMILYGCRPAAQPTPDVPPSPTEMPASIPATASQPVVTPSPQPSVEPVEITAFCTLIGKDAVTHVLHGAPVIIKWGWDAKTEAQLNDYLQNNITTITLDGKSIEGVQSGLVHNQTSGNPEYVWASNVGVLEPGKHTLTYDVKWKKLTDDGTNTYGPGGKIEALHDECQIIVDE